MLNVSTQFDWQNAVSVTQYVISQSHFFSDSILFEPPTLRPSSCSHPRKPRLLEQLSVPQPSLRRLTSSINTVILFVLPIWGLTTWFWCLTKGPLSFLGWPQRPHGDLMMTSLTSAKCCRLIIPEIMCCNWWGQILTVGVIVREEDRDGEKETDRDNGTTKREVYMVSSTKLPRKIKYYNSLVDI